LALSSVGWMLRTAYPRMAWQAEQIEVAFPSAAAKALQAWHFVESWGPLLGVAALVLAIAFERLYKGQLKDAIRSLAVRASVAALLVSKQAYLE